MALLLPKEKRESWPHLTQGLAAYYRSPGRLALLRRRFESAFRRPGLDPTTFATELGILALQGFEDMTEQARDIMIRDKFIAGQSQCALRRQLDGLAPGTPIGEIVDSCRLWESHSERETIPKSKHNGQETEWPSDPRTRERMKPVSDRQLRVSAIDEQGPEDRSEEGPSVIKSLLAQLLQLMQTEGLQEQPYQPLAAGPVCFSFGHTGHGINRCSQLDTGFPYLPTGWSVNMDNGQYRATQREKRNSPVLAGNEEWSGREGQPPGPEKIKARLTLVGGFPTRTNGSPSGGYRRDIIKAPAGRLMLGNSRRWER